MSPIRIIIIAILIYLAFRLITGGRRRSTGKDDRNNNQNREMPVSDTLEEDPVCHKLVPRQQAIKIDHHGKKFYFCSKECCNTFRTQQGEH